MATAIEYGLIAALTGIVIIVGATQLGSDNETTVEAAPIEARFDDDNGGRGMPHLVWTENGAELRCDNGVVAPMARPVGEPPTFVCRDEFDPTSP